MHKVRNNNSSLSDWYISSEYLTGCDQYQPVAQSIWLIPPAKRFSISARLGFSPSCEPLHTHCSGIVAIITVEKQE